MKLARIVSAAFAASLTLTAAFAAGEGWTHDYEAAKKQAAAEGKELLLDFTGSDWCAPCAMLTKEVFSKEEFVKAAKEKFVLVELDFPQDTSKLSQDTLKQNQQLQSLYVPAGYPTVFLCEADGKPYAAHSGYLEGGPEKFLEMLENLRGNKAKRDEGFAAAAKLEGKAKAQSIIDTLKATGLPPASFNNFYKEQMDQVKAADPNDEIGYFSGAEKDAKFNELSTKLTELLMSGKAKEVITLIDAEIDGLEGQQKQGLYLLKALACKETFQFAEGLKAVDEVEKLGGGEEVKSGVAIIRTQLEGARDAFEQRMKDMEKKD
jgi:thioredoxin-related protein